MAYKLFDYQAEYLENMPPDIIMAADTGLGKTIMSLEHARRHNGGNVLDLLVVAPASKVRTGDWQREIEKSGFVRNYFVVSYEGFTKNWHTLVGDTTTIIFDEVHYLANPTSQRGKAALQSIRIARQWIGLSATPLPNGWRSAATYAIATKLVRNKTEFNNRFVVIDRSRGFPLYLGYREEPLLEQWWAGVAKPLERTGDLKLPSRMLPVEPVMDASTSRDYLRAKKERLMPDGDMLDSPSKLFASLRQLPIKTRINALESILEGTAEHAVVFYNFDSEREAILAMLAKNFKQREVYEQSGHRSHLPNYQGWKKMKPSVTLAQYQSASQAIELTYASITVYLSPPTSWANYEQSKGRTRRFGQAKTTLFYHIAVQGSLDKHIWRLVAAKQEFSTTIVNKLLNNTIDNN